MYSEYDYENYYEPSEVDQLVDEFKDKCREFLLPNIKEEINSLNKENSELKTKNEEYRKRENEINSKERDLKYKEENLKREVEREFYQSNIGDTLKDLIEKSEVWFAENRGFTQEKCSLCNNERKLVAKFKNGKTTTTDCECKTLKYTYVPESAELNFIKFAKKDNRYQSDRNFYISKSYSPSKDYYDRNDYSYNEFSLCQVVEKFCDTIKELHETKRYGTKIGFTTKNECQKYCDWLNEQNEEKRNVAKSSK